MNAKNFNMIHVALTRSDLALICSALVIAGYHAKKGIDDDNVDSESLKIALRREAEQYDALLAKLSI